MEQEVAADTELIHQIEFHSWTVYFSSLVPPRTDTHSNEAVSFMRRKTILLSQLNDDCFRCASTAVTHGSRGALSVALMPILLS